MILKKKTLIFVLIAVLSLLVISGCSQKKNTKIRLNEVTHSVFYAPQYVAINNGFFKEVGIEIELVNGGGADKTMTALLSNQADIGFAGPEAAIYVYNEGKEDHAQVIAQLTKRDGSFLVGRAPEPDFKWESLKGKTIIGGRKGGVPEMSLEHVLRKHGLSPGKDVEVLTNVQFDLMAGAFQGGSEDYVTLFEPVASMFEKQEKGHIVASVGEAGGEVPFTAYMAKKSYIQKNKGLVQRFVNAIHKGQKWVQSHSPEEIAKAIKPSFPDTDEALLATVAKRYRDIDAWMSDPVMKKESFELLQDIIEEAGVLKQRASYDKVVHNDFAEKAMKTIK